MNLVQIKDAAGKRLPSMPELLALYGVIAFIVYGWTIYWYLWKLPSWLYFMPVSEILVIFAYAQIVNFLETLIVLALPLLLSLALPVRWYRERFVARSAVLVIVLLAALARYVIAITALFSIPSGLLWSALLVALGAALLVFLVGRVTILARAMEEIANRAFIFVYIFAPLTAISLAVVLIRNIAALLSRT